MVLSRSSTIAGSFLRASTAKNFNLCRGLTHQLLYFLTTISLILYLFWISPIFINPHFPFFGEEAYNLPLSHPTTTNQPMFQINLEFYKNWSTWTITFYISFSIFWLGCLIFCYYYSFRLSIIASNRKSLKKYFSKDMIDDFKESRRESLGVLYDNSRDVFVDKYQQKNMELLRRLSEVTERSGNISIGSFNSIKGNPWIENYAKNFNFATGGDWIQLEAGF